MRANTALRRCQKTLRNAIAAVKNGNAYRSVEARYHEPRSTLSDIIRRLDKPSATQLRRYALSEKEKTGIVQLLLHCSDRGVPLTQKHAGEAAGVMLSTLSPERKSQLPFKNGIPGIKWVRSFCKRHRNELQYAVPNMQESKRFRATNASTLASHFSLLSALVSEYGFDARRVWSLDETGTSPRPRQTS